MIYNARMSLKIKIIAGLQPNTKIQFVAGLQHNTKIHLKDKNYLYC